jgi:hypothetical protein
MAVVVNWNSIPSGLAIAPACGLPSSRFVPASLQGQAAIVAQGNVPPSAPSDFVPYCTACLIARGIIYYKSTPGDCGTPTSLNLENAQITGAVGQVASGIASMAGGALPGIGIAVQAIQQIFAHHAQAVATEQATICQVAGVLNQVFAYYDTLVATGQLDPSDAYVGMQNFLNQASEQLQSIEKTCNAACVYQGIIKAHAAFCQSYYPAIAPIQIAPHAPAAPPASLGNVPGGTIQVGGALPTASGVGGQPIYASTGTVIVPTSPNPIAAAAPLAVIGGISFSATDVVIGLLALVAILLLGMAVSK